MTDTKQLPPPPAVIEVNLHADLPDTAPGAELVMDLLIKISQGARKGYVTLDGDECALLEVLLGDASTAKAELALRDIRRTRIVVDVLHEGSLEWDSLSDLEALSNDCNVSLFYGMGDEVALTRDEVIVECEKHATSPSFFGLDVPE